MRLAIKDLSKNAKPRERMAVSGRSALSDPELLAIVIGSGGKEASAFELANQLLSHYNGFSGLASACLADLQKFKNIGTARACAILACIEIGLRLGNLAEPEKFIVNKPEDIFRLLKKDFYGKETECLYLISLDTRCRVLSTDLLSTGTINETLIHPREIYKKALQSGAVSIVLAHNHPSGDTQPSEDDVKVTRRVMRVGFEIGIPLLDHLIIFNNEFSSMKVLNLIHSEKKGGD